MKHPISTGRAARLIDVTEPRLSDLVRQGKVRPAPWVIGGRRHWFAEHLEQAARALGILTPDLQAAIDKAAPLGGEALEGYAPHGEGPALDEKKVEHAS
jgi:hypothetical protein